MPIFTELKGSNMESFLDQEPDQPPVYEQDQYADSDSVIDEIDEEEDFLAEMSEVEVRLEEANCYKALLNNSLFNDASPIAKRVEVKIRDFIKSELKVLLGLQPQQQARQATVVNQFTSEQADALKEIATRLIEKKNAGPVVPTVNPTTVAPQKVEAPRVNTTSVKSPVKIPQVKVTQSAAPPVKAKGRPKKPATEPAVIMKEMAMPNGQVMKVAIRPSGQTRAAPGTQGGYPNLTGQNAADQASMMAQHQALNVTPTSGIMGVARLAVERGLITNQEE